MDFTSIYTFVGAHWLLLFAGYFLFMAFVSGMPKPETVPQWNGWYRWLYESLHILSGNIDKMFGKFLSKFFPTDTPNEVSGK